MGAGTSRSARPVRVGPYGAGASVKSSDQVSAVAGMRTTVLRGTVITCPFRVIVPPAIVSPAPSVASWMNPTIWNGETGWTGFVAAAAPLAHESVAAAT